MSLLDDIIHGRRAPPRAHVRLDRALRVIVVGIALALLAAWAGGGG